MSIIAVAASREKELSFSTLDNMNKVAIGLIAPTYHPYLFSQNELGVCSETTRNPTRHVSRINKELLQISHCEITQTRSEFTGVDKLDDANRIAMVTDWQETYFEGGSSQSYRENIVCDVSMAADMLSATRIFSPVEISHSATFPLGPIQFGGLCRFRISRSVNANLNPNYAYKYRPNSRHNL